MSDLIRREATIEAFLPAGGLDYAHLSKKEIVAILRALPAVQPVTVQLADAQQIQTLREEIAKLETLCDHDCDNEDCLRCFHYPEILEQKRTALRALAQPDLSDPAVVHLNMLRGTIAKPSLKQIIHLYGVDALAPLIVREAGNEPS